MQTPEHISKPGKNTQEQNGELTPEYAARLIFWSFKLSQGNTELHREIFEYIHSIQPQWRITGEMKDEIIQKSVEISNKYLNGSSASPHRVDQEKMRTEIKGQLELLTQFLEKNTKYERPKEHILQVLQASFIERDFNFIKNGRKSSPDKYVSYICDYILKSKKTSIPEYDKMLADLKPLVIEDLKDTVEDPRFFTSLEKIVQEYNLANPKDPVDLKALTKKTK